MYVAAVKMSRITCGVTPNGGPCPEQIRKRKELRGKTKVVGTCAENGRRISGKKRGTDVHGRRKLIKQMKKWKESVERKLRLKDLTVDAAEEQNRLVRNTGFTRAGKI